MRVEQTCYRAHDPKWSFKPISGDGAAIWGGRFNPKGTTALYLALDPVTALKEANQGLANKLVPYVLCSYDVDCEDIADLRTPYGRAAAGADVDDMGCAWFAIANAREEPPSWSLARRLMAAGHAGILVPSYAPGATDGDHNIVLWTWTAERPHRVTVYDPSGRLPKSQLSRT